MAKLCVVVLCTRVSASMQRCNVCVLLLLQRQSLKPSHRILASLTATTQIRSLASHSAPTPPTPSLTAQAISLPTCLQAVVGRHPSVETQGGYGSAHSCIGGAPHLYREEGCSLREGHFQQNYSVFLSKLDQHL